MCWTDSALAIIFTDVAAVGYNIGGIEVGWAATTDSVGKVFTALRCYVGRKSEATRVGRKAARTESEDDCEHVSLLSTTVEIFLVSSEDKTADYSS